MIAGAIDERAIDLCWYTFRLVHFLISRCTISSIFFAPSWHVTYGARDIPDIDEGHGYIVDGRKKLEPCLARIGLAVRAIRRGRRSCHERSHGDLLDHAPDRPGIDQPLSRMGYKVGYVEACARSFYYSHAHRHRPQDRKAAPNRSRR